MKKNNDELRQKLAMERLDRACRDNPDLPRDFIEGVLKAKDEKDDGTVYEFEFKD